MKKLGMVGGIGPESTLEYYRGVIDGFRARIDSGNYPAMIIDSLNLTEMYDLAASKNWDVFTQRLVSSVSRLAAAGAEFAVMAANTAHIVFGRVREQSPIPLISIVEETCKSAKVHGCKRVVVLGTAFTMSSGLYTEAFTRYGIDAFVPTDEEQQTIHSIIFPHLQEGIVLPEEKSAMLRIGARMVAAHSADAVILGCTELPLIIKDGDLDVLLLDTTRIHIEAILNHIVG